MSWHWQPVYRPDAGSTETGLGDNAELGLDQHFPTQGDAESWLGEIYPDLMQAGIEAVTLYDEDRLVYGPMRLEPEVN